MMTATATTRPARRNARPAPKRWTVVSVPGRLDDGSDTAWFVFDRLAGATDTRRASVMETFEEARAEARWRNERA